MAERWFPVAGYEGLYEVSNRGRVRSVDRVIWTKRSRGKRFKSHRRSHILKPTTTKKGYLMCALSVRGRQRSFLVHRLVLKAFVGPCPLGKEAAHRDGNRKNNRDENLRWATPLENCEDRKNHGNTVVGNRNGKSKLKKAEVTKIRGLISDGLSQAKIAKRFGVSQSAIAGISRGRTWSHHV